MRNLVIGMAMASTMLATPALARDDSFYVQVDGGVMLVEDIAFDVLGFNDSTVINTDGGFDFGGIVGYDFGPARLEIEASYREADVRDINVFGGGFPINAGVQRAPIGFYPAAGQVNSLSFMVNGLVDFGPDDGLQGYLGAGAGIARTGFEARITQTGPLGLDDSETGFAWQAIAGLRYPLSDRIDAGLKYRFFNAEQFRLTDRQGFSAIDGSFRSHSLLGSLTYNFGEPAAPPPPPPPTRPTPPPPPTPTPPPPPAPECNTGPYIVFFNWDRSDITPEAAAVLNNAVSAYSNCGSAAVMLAGYTDRSGTVQYNLGLAARRNASVREYLTQRGIPGGRISSEAFGEANPRVPTADGVRELQNRRVEITYGPGSGM